MLQKSRKTGKWYSVESLTDTELLDLGFSKELKKKLEKIPKSIKKTRVQKESKSKGD